MIDVHCHLIPSVDDGSKNIEETISMIKEAKNVGFTDIILTPHFLKEFYETNPSQLLSINSSINEIIKKQEIDVNLFTGMEAYISDDIKEMFNNKKIVTLANSRYILIELPLSAQVIYLKDIISFFKSISVEPIIAHPERYTYIQKKPSLIQEYINMGILIQCNYASILGVYGLEAKKTIKKLLKNNQVDFLGSDCHKPNTIYKSIPKATKKIIKIIGKDKFYKLSTINPKKIIENKPW